MPVTLYERSDHYMPREIMYCLLIIGFCALSAITGTVCCILAYFFSRVLNRLVIKTGDARPGRAAKEDI